MLDESVVACKTRSTDFGRRARRPRQRQEAIYSLDESVDGSNPYGGATGWRPAACPAAHVAADAADAGGALSKSMHAR